MGAGAARAAKRPAGQAAAARANRRRQGRGQPRRRWAAAAALVRVGFDASGFGAAETPTSGRGGGAKDGSLSRNLTSSAAYSNLGSAAKPNFHKNVLGARPDQMKNVLLAASQKAIASVQKREAERKQKMMRLNPVITPTRRPSSTDGSDSARHLANARSMPSLRPGGPEQSLPRGTPTPHNPLLPVATTTKAGAAVAVLPLELLQVKGGGGGGEVEAAEAAARGRHHRSAGHPLPAPPSDSSHGHR